MKKLMVACSLIRLGSIRVKTTDKVATFLAVLKDVLPGLGLLVVTMIAINVPQSRRKRNPFLIAQECMKMERTVLMLFLSNTVILDRSSMAKTESFQRFFRMKRTLRVSQEEAKGLLSKRCLPVAIPFINDRLIDSD